MVQGKKAHEKSDSVNKDQASNIAFQQNDVADARGGSTGNSDGKPQNKEHVLGNVGGDDGVDEEKYSAVRRQQDFPPLGSSNSNSNNNKYTPPARRAPTGQTRDEATARSTVLSGAYDHGAEARSTHF
ncbi:hypothetical protein L207DRAFT_576818 [Hyaloscypha variabilis F]|uniref:Uncharacterized protein n=1 Tax=Hyaloscypha variabilis (strain UAMH 11265 / GT02V1 / F) TaxID=1149755 RepID=A0A2J6S595_HYAVF|nr:hypothetical protein L207DRAFT_576818 [Hyaloscypha variabilis F]